MPSWKRPTSALSAAIACLALVSFATEAHSQTAQYVAKYICGSASGAAAQGAGIVATGTYFTSINVHNPNKTDVGIEKIFDIALPSEKQGGRIATPVKASLKPQEAFEIECADILQHLDSNPKLFTKGFVSIESSGPLDVVAVYTASASPTGPVVALHTERVPKE